MTLHRILLIDDDRLLGDLIELALLPEKTWQLKICGSGEDALVVAPVYLPDLILLDVEMPVMNGWETLSRLREIPSVAKTPVLWISGREQNGMQPMMQQPGVLGVIQKPFVPAQLVATIRELWLHRLRENPP